jgi:endonuclease-3
MKKKPTGRKVAQKSAETKPPKIVTGAKAQAYAAEITEILAVHYADVECALVHKNPFELLIATILSAQCTDERVNMVTPALFAAGPTPAKMAALPIPQLEKLIQSTGFFRNKAQNIHGCCEALVRDHAGEVPPVLESLVKLPGVGRKTANVVLGTAFSIPSGVVVDTHVSRISQRLGLTTATDAVKIEQDLIARLPEGEWINFSHRLIHHGRRICKARKPACDECPWSDLCPRHGVT